MGNCLEFDSINKMVEFIEKTTCYDVLNTNFYELDIMDREMSDNVTKTVGFDIINDFVILDISKLP